MKLNELGICADRVLVLIQRGEISGDIKQSEVACERQWAQSEVQQRADVEDQWRDNVFLKIVEETLCHF